MLYLLLKWLHVLAAIALVGSHATYGVWIVRGSSHPEVMPFTLRNITWLDARVATPAFVALLVTGAAMAVMLRAWLTAPWLLAALALFGLVFLTHMAWYLPTLRRLTALLDREGMNSPGYQAAAHREANLGISMVAVMIVIIFLMVVKPGF